MRYPNGQPVRLTFTDKDTTGALVDAGALVLTLQKPDATQVTFSSPVHTGTGQYYQDLATTDLSQNGHYQYKWVATGAGASATFGTFEVFDPFEVRVLSLNDAKQACNIPAAVTTYDSELMDMTASVESMLERLTGGPIYTRQVTELGVPGSHFYTQLVLKYRPVQSVVSITDWLGVSLPITFVKIDDKANALYQAAGIPFVGSSSINYLDAIRFDVVYTAGWGTIIPPAFLTAARIIASSLWMTQRGPVENPALGGLSATTAQATIEASYGAPVQALQVLQPYLLEAYI